MFRNTTLLLIAVLTVFLCHCVSAYTFVTDKTRSVNLKTVKRNGISINEATFRKYVPGQTNKWPGIYYDKFDNIDFSEYGYLNFLVIYDNPYQRRLGIRLDSKTGSQYFYHRINIGCNLVRINMKELTIDPHITNVDIFLQTPDYNITYLVSPVTLGDSPNKNTVDLIVKETGAPDFLNTNIDLLQKAHTPYGNYAAGRLKGIRSVMTGENHSQKFDLILSQALWKGEDYKANIANAGSRKTLAVYTAPSTLNLRKTQIPKPMGRDIDIHSARGEGASVIICGGEKSEHVDIISQPLSDEAGNTITPDIFIVGCVPVNKPSPPSGGFGMPGLYPDPLIPQTSFQLEPWQTQTVLVSCYVPQDAQEGVYTGKLTVKADSGEYTIPVSLTVHSPVIPVRGHLKACWVNREEAAHSEYNGNAWTGADLDGFMKLCLRYRIVDNIVPDIWPHIFSVQNGKVTAKWETFDDTIEKWIRLGKTAFYISGLGEPRSLDDIRDKEIIGQKLTLLSDHLAEKGWADIFYLYPVDEPEKDEAEKVKEMFQWIHKHGSNIRILMTEHMGIPEEYIGFADIIVSDIPVYDTKIGPLLHRRDGQHWLYTCVNNLYHHYPDNWKIDTWAASHRALGWWLFRYDCDGFLYWGIDRWDEANPWENAETYPGGNGDGSMFYSDPERKGLPYPSLRCELWRDGAEDYELLLMLKARCGELAGKEIPQEWQILFNGAKKILSCDAVLPAKDNYSHDDYLYSELHRQILELLDRM